MSNLVLLGIFAHPDDESFGPGGTIAKYVAEGVAVHIAIATDGAAGSYDEEHIQGYESLAQRRAEELEGAVRALGATLHTLGYRDSGMAGTPDNEHADCLVQAPLDEVGCRIVALMREVRPQVVVTHDPTGGYFHPDHIKVNQAVLRAWEWSNDPNACPDLALPPWQPSRLFYGVIPGTWLRRIERLLRLFRQDPTRFGRNGDIDLTKLGTPDDQIHTRLDVRSYLAQKQEASAQHVSQGGGNPLAHWLPMVAQRWLFGSEVFTQVVPEPPPALNDFFEGLR